MDTAEANQSDASVFMNLPDLVWETIASTLKAHHRAILRGVCRKFRTLVNNTVTKIKLDPSSSEDPLSWRLHARFPRLEHLEALKPSDQDCLTDPVIAQLALKDLCRLPRLTSLGLESCTQLTVAGLAALALAVPGVEKLVLPQVCQLSRSDSLLLVLHRLPRLSHLKLQCCRHCDEAALAPLSLLSGLTALELEDYGLALKQVSQLTCLTALRSIMVWSDYSLNLHTDPPGHPPHLPHPLPQPPAPNPHNLPPHPHPPNPQHPNLHHIHIPPHGLFGL
ncbi:hypothetical protein Agub_g8912, partial [Astrephomene gubernaculifera]